jgi:hypothetical protein
MLVQKAFVQCAPKGDLQFFSYFLEREVKVVLSLKKIFVFKTSVR